MIVLDDAPRRDERYDIVFVRALLRANQLLKLRLQSLDFPLQILGVVLLALAVPLLDLALIPAGNLGLLRERVCRVDGERLGRLRRAAGYVRHVEAQDAHGFGNQRLVQRGQVRERVEVNHADFRGGVVVPGRGNRLHRTAACLPVRLECAPVPPSRRERADSAFALVSRASRKRTKTITLFS